MQNVWVEELCGSRLEAHLSGMQSADAWRVNFHLLEEGPGRS